jgi:hypothetical protein
VNRRVHHRAEHIDLGGLVVGHGILDDDPQRVGLRVRERRRRHLILFNHDNEPLSDPSFSVHGQTKYVPQLLQLGEVVIGRVRLATAHFEPEEGRHHILTPLLRPLRRLRMAP